MDKTKIAVAVFDKLAKEYQDKFMDVSLYSDTFDFFCDSISRENAEVLEIACGPGNITNYLLGKRPDLKILGIDLAPKMIELAKDNNPTAKFQIMDCRDIEIFENKFDAIVCGFCLPYLSKEETKKLIADSSILLNPDGLLYISTMEADYSNSGLQKGSSGDEIYMHFHEAGYLTAFLKENHFTVLSVVRKNSIMSNGTEVVDLVIISKR